MFHRFIKRVLAIELSWSETIRSRRKLWNLSRITKNLFTINLSLEIKRRLNLDSFWNFFLSHQHIYKKSAKRVRVLWVNKKKTPLIYMWLNMGDKKKILKTRGDFNIRDFLWHFYKLIGNLLRSFGIQHKLYSGINSSERWNQ